MARPRKFNLTPIIAQSSQHPDCDMPDVKVSREAGQMGTKRNDAEDQWQLELIGLDTFGPVRMVIDPRGNGLLVVEKPKVGK